MNILLAANYKAQNSGNFISSLIELGKSARARGDRIVFVFPRQDSHPLWYRWFDDMSLDLIQFDDKKDINNQIRDLSSIINEYDIDTVYLHFGIFTDVFLKHRSELTIGNKALSVFVHDHMDFPHAKNGIKDYLYPYYIAYQYRKAGIKYIAISDRKYNFYRKLLRNVWKLPNAISTSRYVSHHLDRDEQRALLNLRDNEKMCLFLGWSLDVKGLDIALRAGEILHQRNDRFVLGVVGFGTKPSESASEYIANKADVDINASWIKFLPSAEDIYAYHKAADLYLSSSRTESFSYGVLEAISQNKPVVVSDIPGTKWAWEYTKCISYPVEDYYACAKAVEQAIDMDIKSNYKEIINNYSIDNWCDSVISILHSDAN